MRVAEELYSQGYISYPRTETTKYAPSYDITSAMKEMQYAGTWGKTVQRFMRDNKGYIRVPTQGYDAGDHPPITPCMAANRGEFKKVKQWKLYEFICKHFIGTVMPDATYTEYTVTAQLQGFPTFTTTYEAGCEFRSGFAPRLRFFFSVPRLPLFFFIFFFLFCRAITLFFFS